MPYVSLTADQVTQTTTVGEIDRAMKIWKEKLNNPQKAQKLEYAKNKIIKHHQANKTNIKKIESGPNAGKVSETDRVNYLKLAADGYREASIVKINAFLDSEHRDQEVDLRAPLDPNKVFDFFEGKSGLNLLTVMKTGLATAAIGTAFTAGGFSLVSTVFTALWAFNPAVAIGLGAVAVAGLLKVIGKVFGPEIKKGWAAIKKYQNQHRDFRIESEKMEAEEKEKETKKELKEIEDQEKHNETLKNFKDEAKKLGTLFYSDDQVNELRENMKKAGLSQEEIEDVLKKNGLQGASKDDFSQQFDEAKNDTKSNKQIDKFIDEYNKALNEIFSDKNYDSSKVENAIKRIENLSQGKGVNGTAVSRAMVSDAKAQAFAQKLVEIAKEAKKMREEHTLQRDKDAQMKDIYKQHGMKDAAKNGLDAEFGAGTP